MNYNGAPPKHFQKIKDSDNTDKKAPIYKTLYFMTIGF